MTEKGLLGSLKKGWLGSAAEESREGRMLSFEYCEYFEYVIS